MRDGDIVEDGHTIDDTESMETFDQVDPAVHVGSAQSLVPGPSDARYDILGTLGVGGMGKVELFRDRWIGREIACKSMAKKRRKDRKALNAFMREAKIQGQLEHPAVVPVHDLAFEDDESPTFTMKRVRGRTFRELIAAEERPPLRRLLEAFHRVCLAIDYAHRRGVIHRDLKPENVMVGDFGEVYVLDWGIAKLVGEPTTGDKLDMEGILQSSPNALAKKVPTGTLGYMSPEQVRCEELDPRSDVYGLGLILYEVLTGQKTHPTKLPQVFYSTLQEVGRASEVAQVPPELDEACALALRVDRDHRVQSARALADLIQAYLDGDRDLEARRRRAAELVDRATALLVEAREERSERKQQSAGRQIAQALALAPDDARVRSSFLAAITEPPFQTPAEVEQQLRDDHAAKTRQASTFAAILYTLFAVCVGGWMLVFRPTIHEPGLIAVGMASIMAAAAGSLWLRRTKVPRDFHQGVIFVLATVAICVLSRVLSPWVLVPTLLITNAFGFAIIGGRTLRRFVVGFTVLVTPALAVFDVASSRATASFVENGMWVGSQVVTGERVGDLFVAVPGVLAVVFLIFLYSVVRVLETNEEVVSQLATQRWRLRQLLPKGVGSELEIPTMGKR